MELSIKLTASATMFLTAGLLSAHAATTSTTAESAPERHPNIIYIYADDLGYGEIGTYGQTKIRTPHLDRMAAEGIKFTRHYTGTPVCAPARCNLLTGLHSGHAVVRGNYEMGSYTDETEGGQMPLPPHTQTLGGVLQKAGYVTACLGKWGLGNTQTSGHPNLQGFDYFFGYLDQKQAHNYYPTHLWENDKPYPLKNQFISVHENRGKQDSDVDFAKYQTGDHACDHMTTKALAFIDANKDQPFFLYFPTPLPHVSLQPKQEFLEAYLKDFPDDPPYLGDKGYAPHPHPRAAYAAMITMMDAQVGAIMDKVEQLGLSENTLVMFSSDNGPTFDAGGVNTDFFNSAAGLRGHKGELFEGGIRAPMLARWPGKIKQGSVSDHRSVQYDVLPTISELINVPVAKPVDGISFLPTLLSQPGEQKKHDFMYWEFPERGGTQAVVRAPWKIIKTKMRAEPNAQWQLYNLEEDPGEKQDVSADHADIVKELDVLAKQSHWHPMVQEFEFVDPKFEPKELH